MTIRASGTAEICFGPVPVFVKLYSVASEKSVALSQVHAKCGGKVEQQYFCVADNAVVPRPALAKQYRLPDGAVTTLTEEEVKSAESERIGTLDVLECIPEDGIDPIYLGKAMLLGPDEDHGIDGYSTFVDALAATRTAAVGVLYTRTRDQLVLIQRYRERGLLMRELFYEGEMRAIEEVQLPLSVRASLPVGAFEMWTAAVERRRSAGFSVGARTDGYPARLLHAAERKVDASGERAAPASPHGENELLKAARKQVANNVPARPAKAVPREPASVRRLPARAARGETPPEAES